MPTHYPKEDSYRRIYQLLVELKKNDNQKKTPVETVPPAQLFLNKLFLLLFPVVSLSVVAANLCCLLVIHSSVRDRCSHQPVGWGWTFFLSFLYEQEPKTLDEILVKW